MTMEIIVRKDTGCANNFNVDRRWTGRHGEREADKWQVRASGDEEPDATCRVIRHRVVSDEMRRCMDDRHHAGGIPVAVGTGTYWFLHSSLSAERVGAQRRQKGCPLETHCVCWEVRSSVYSRHP